VRKADNLPPSSADVTESGSLNLPEPSGPHRPVMGSLTFCILQFAAQFEMRNLHHQSDFINLVNPLTPNDL
jgi:hypothetical protein